MSREGIYDRGKSSPSSTKQKSQEGFKKFDEGKPRMSLVPPWAIEGVARVMTHGEKKYDAWNWLNPTKWSKFLDPALRHVNALEKSEDIDESGLPTVYHAIAELMMLATVMELKIGTDDRPMALFAKMREATEDKQEHPDCNATCRNSGDCNHVPTIPCDSEVYRVACRTEPQETVEEKPVKTGTNTCTGRQDIVV